MTGLSIHPAGLGEPSLSTQPDFDEFSRFGAFTFFSQLPGIIYCQFLDNRNTRPNDMNNSRVSFFPEYEETKART